MELEERKINGEKFVVGIGTTDENCLKEVVLESYYRHSRFGFDIERGEKWLDLGGNVGAFALYCKLKGATCVSYEPEPVCFELLKYNIRNWEGFEAHNCSITNIRQKKLQFYMGSKESDKYRNSIFANKRAFQMSFNNLHAENIEDKFDGVKIDIEGSEFGLIDDDLIPECEKLVIEYHITKDKSMTNFHRRMDILRTKFKEVYYMKSLDKFDKNSNYPGFFDRLVYCKNKIK